jgi:dipeptide/tripeptide permease
MVSMMMGVWFLSSAAAGPLSGKLGTLWSQISHENFFLMCAVAAITVGLGFFAILKPLKRAIGHGKEGAADL